MMQLYNTHTPPKRSESIMINPSPEQEAIWAKQKAECLAKHVAKLGRRAPFFLDKWSAKHGKESAEKLRQEARVMWRKK